MFPFVTLTPERHLRGPCRAARWVPMDDTHTMIYTFSWKQAHACALRDAEGRQPDPGLVTPDAEYLPNTTDWLGRWRLKAQPRERLPDRPRHAEERAPTPASRASAAQDQAMIESMGEIVDRSLEHLAPSDRMITITRRRLLKAARELREHGTVPPGVDHPDVFRRRARRRVRRARGPGLARRLSRTSRNDRRPAAAGARSGVGRWTHGHSFDGAGHIGRGRRARRWAPLRHGRLARTARPHRGALRARVARSTWRPARSAKARARSSARAS